MRPFGLGCVEMDIATNPAAAEATEAAVVLALLPAFETCSLLLDPIPLALVAVERAAQRTSVVSEKSKKKIR